MNGVSGVGWHTMYWTLEISTAAKSRIASAPRPHCKQERYFKVYGVDARVDTISLGSLR